MSNIETEMMQFVSDKIKEVVNNDVEEDGESLFEYGDFIYSLNTKETKMSTSDCGLAMLVTAYLNKKMYGEKNNRSETVCSDDKTVTHEKGTC